MITGTEGSNLPSSSTITSSTRVCVATSNLGTSRRSAHSPRSLSDRNLSTFTTGALQRRLAKRVVSFPKAVQRVDQSHRDQRGEARLTTEMAPSPLHSSASVTNGSNP